MTFIVFHFLAVDFARWIWKAQAGNLISIVRQDNQKLS